jgi:uncharacterized protein (TIGR03083 family)
MELRSVCMTLPRHEVVPGLRDELVAFEALIRSLSSDEWTRPSRCAGWSVADVAAHVTGTMADIVAGRFDGLGSPEVTEREVVERRGRTPSDLADELHEVAQQGDAIMSTFDDAAWDGPGPTDLVPTLGRGVETLWYDTYVHAEDIRAAVGRRPERGPGLRASASHLADELTQRGWGPATVRGDGWDPVAVSGGGGTVVEDPLQFVLAATGRIPAGDVGLDDEVNIYR